MPGPRVIILRTIVGAGAMLLGACVNPAKVVDQLVQFTPNTGRFLSDRDLTIELRDLDQASYEHFKVFYRGRERQPEIVVPDVSGDRYSFDARNWHRVEGGAAMTLVHKSIDSGKHVEAIVGSDTFGRLLGFGVAVKKPEKPAYADGEFHYVVRYQHFGRYEIARIRKTNRRPERTERDGTISDGQ